MMAPIITDFLAIIALCYTIGLAKRNIIFDNHKNMIYLLLSVTTIMLLLLEIAAVLMQHSINVYYIIPHRFVNIIGFSLCPIVPIFLYFFNNNMKMRSFFKNLLALPLYFNIIICILSSKTGWIFYVDTHNLYIRGEYFIIPTIISFFYFGLAVMALIKNNVEYEKDDKKILITVYAVPLLGVIVQILLKNVLLIWLSTAVSLLLYYIFLRELQFKYDIQTGIKNRAAFEKEMEKYQREDKNAAIVMVDVNNLKSINDKQGHKAGDEIIKCTANIIKDSFCGIGNTFRIGGDEFCVICKETSNELLAGAFSDLDQLLLFTNKKRDNQIVLAYGCALYTYKDCESIYATFIEADKAMYMHKAKLKGL